MKTAFVLCFFLLTAASQENGETSEDLSPKNGGVDGDADKVKSKEAAGHEKHFHGDQHFESSTCSMEASYGLALNGDRFFCRDTASTDYDSCVACCV
uniref:Secreted protein n=1 Tax=Plectus sambesii TaxID=2011161 RepID=A0A914UTQ5_9BILA